MIRFKLLLLLLLTLMIPVSVHAAAIGDIFTIDNFSYEIKNVGTQTVYLAGSTANGTITVPLKVVDKYNVEWKVTGISWRGKYQNVTTIIIPEGITYIDINAFNESKITTINIPASVNYIADGAFRTCTSLKNITVSTNNPLYMAHQGVLYKKDTTGKANILISYPNAKLETEYSIPEGVKEITRIAFFRNNNIQKLTLPSSFDKFNYYETSAEVGRGSIFECTRLTAIDVNSGSSKFKSKDGVLYSYDDKTLVLYPMGKTSNPYAVAEGTTTIGRSAFLSAKNLKSITFPNTIANINQYAFMSSGITSITIPKNVNTLGDGVFSDCKLLTAINVDNNNNTYASDNGVVYNKAKTELLLYPTAKPGDYEVPNTVTTIKKSACQYTTKLGKITLPSSVKTIEQSAFESSSLTELAFTGIPRLETIGIRAFCWAHLSEVYIPASVKTIEYLAFYSQVNENKTMLKKVRIANGSQLTSIVKEAFMDNFGLTDFIFEGSCKLEKIGSNVFRNDKSLKSFTFPQTVKDIDDSAFNGCVNMKSAIFLESSSIENIAEGAFQFCGLEKLTLPSSVKNIRQSAFNSCNKLVSIDLPAATIYVDPRAFQLCNKLIAINAADDNATYSSIDGVLLSKNKETLKIFPAGKANDEFTLLPPSITTIGEYSFYYCQNLKNVTIPNKVNKIEKAAFQLCDNLNTVTFLCDNMIPATNIAQGGNERAFDDGTNGSKNIFATATANVRKEKLSEYKADNYYKKFKAIVPSFIDGKEEYIAVSDNAVDLLNTTTTDYTYVIPQQVSKEGKTYKVALLGDYLFQHVGNTVREVVVFNNVRYIGSRAFMTTANLTQNSSTIENLFFIESTPTNQMLSTTRFKLRKSDLGTSTSNIYNEIAETTNIYVKKSAENTYKTQWQDYVSKISYKIPGVKIGTKYGTFAREFDTDFSDYKNAHGHTDIAAFTAGSPIYAGSGDYNYTEGTYHIKMRSIDEKGGVIGNYGYVPANTGVLLKVLDKEATNNDFYYTIGEYDTQNYTVVENIMTGVTINNTAVIASESSPVYLIQGGVFRKATANINPFPIHKAYFKTGALPAGARLVLIFDEFNGSTTGIKNIEDNQSSKSDNTYYNLNGQRVEKPRSGIYVHNGKKVIIK